MRFIHLSCLMLLLSVVVALFVCVAVAVDTASASASDSSDVSVSATHVSRVLNNAGNPTTTPNGLTYQCSFKFPKKKKHDKHEKHEKSCDKREKHEKWCEKWEKPEKCDEKHEKCEKHDDKHEKCEKHDDKHEKAEKCDDKHEKPEKCEKHGKNETCCDKHDKHEKPEKHEKKQKCFAYGFVCFDEGPAGTLCKADDIAKPMVVQCTNGFSLYEDDAADELEEQALWLNADGVEPEVTATTPPSFATPSPGNKVVTLYVQNFEPLTQGQTTGTFNRTATLLISEPCGLVKRVNGQCSFAFVKDFNGIVAVLAPQGGVPLLIEDADEDEDEEEDD